MRANKTLDCVQMKRRIQEKIHGETKNLTRAELIAYFRHHAETGLFAKLWKNAQRAGSSVRP